MIVDLFSGARGWCEGLRLLGHRGTLGIEINPTAGLTAVANGHPTLVASVTEVNPRVFLGRTTGLVASPPCQGFSMAGKGKGREDIPAVFGALEWVALGAGIDETFVALRAACKDERTALVLEPLRWVLDLAPAWTAWEQVPAVLPLWERCAEILRAVGYSAWTGVVQAERYGVPQTRKRAVLIASCEHEVGEPVATHSRFYSNDPSRLDDGVLPWVSMGEALGVDGIVRTNNVTQGSWGTRRYERSMDAPAPTVTTVTDRWVMRSNYGTGGDPAARGERSINQPAPTVTSKIGRNKWVMSKLMGSGMVERYGDRPARSLEQPSFTITGTSGGGSKRYAWTSEEGDRRNVSIEEAAALQSFREGYVWHGNSGEKFLQVGNAVPPLLARAIAAEAMGVTLRSVAEVA